jgi:hypothetical protein
MAATSGPFGGPEMRNRGMEPPGLFAQSESCVQGRRHVPREEVADDWGSGVGSPESRHVTEARYHYRCSGRKRGGGHLGCTVGVLELPADYESRSVDTREVLVLQVDFSRQRARRELLVLSVDALGRRRQARSRSHKPRLASPSAAHGQVRLLGGGSDAVERALDAPTERTGIVISGHGDPDDARVEPLGWPVKPCDRCVGSRSAVLPQVWIRSDN